MVRERMVEDDMNSPLEFIEKLNNQITDLIKVVNIQKAQMEIHHEVLKNQQQQILLLKENQVTLKTYIDDQINTIVQMVSNRNGKPSSRRRAKGD